MVTSGKARLVRSQTVGVKSVKDRSLWVGSRWQAPFQGRGGEELLE